MSKPDPSRHAPQEVDAYLAPLPEEVRSSLERIRSIVRSVAPDCTERVSYGIAMFRLSQDLVGISAHKNHCSLHSASLSLVRAMAEELAGLKVSGATIHFTPQDPLPEHVVEAVVRGRMREMGAA